MKMSVLRRKAAEEGLGKEELDPVDDSDTPRQDLIALLVDVISNKTSSDDGHHDAEEEVQQQNVQMLEVCLRHLATSGMPIRGWNAAIGAVRRLAEVPGCVCWQRLREEFAGLKMSQLKKHALAEGVTIEEVDAAYDADNPRSATPEGLPC